MDELYVNVNDCSESEIQQKLPRYKCHKEVCALKISKIRDDENRSSRVLVPAEPGYAPFWVGPAFVRKHDPQPGGYYVVYADGWRSYSPGKAFEEGYTPIQNSVTLNGMLEWKQYKRRGLSEMRPYVPGEDVSGVSISEADARNGSPREGDMIARNPENHRDQWLVCREYFEANLEPA